MIQTIKKFTAILLVIITIFSAAVIPSAAKKAENTSEISQITKIRSYDDRYHNGFISPSINGFLKIFDCFNLITRILTGFPIFDKNKLTFTADGFVGATLTELAETSFFNGYEFAGNVPLTVDSSERIIKLFRIDMETVVPQLQSEVDDIYRSGDTFKFVVAELLLIYLRQLKEVDVHEEKISDTVYRVCADIVYNYGGTDHMNLDFYYDTEKQLFYSGSGKGIFDLGFNVDTSTYTLTSVVNSWQRRFGFCLAYDFIANIIIMDYDTERVKFTYGGKDWMIQFWKGRYFVCPGAEIGIYNRDEKEIGSYYDCASDDELMNMSLELYHDDELIFSEGPMMHWWLTGFNIGEKYYLPESLMIKGFIEFPSEEMASLFTQSAQKHERMSVEQDGVKVSYQFK